MKLAVVGGAGVRAPLLMSALTRREQQVGLTEVVLMDANEEKLALMGPISAFAAQKAGGRFRLEWTTSLDEALQGAEAVITTIRVGGEEARVQDERIALAHGVLGQETTGPGGFAMALRSIPAVAEIARRMRDVCPDAWLLNFTNPAGLVVQGLVGEFPDLKIAGICDTPSGMRHQVAAAFGKKTGDVPVRFFGLNHLSWMSEALVDGENVVPRIVSDQTLAARVPELALFDFDLVRLIGLLPNEYLYYYYYRETAVQNIQAARETRGEQVQRLSAELLRDLYEIDPGAHADRAWKRYRDYIDERRGTYMTMESGSASHHEEDWQESAPAEEGEGYAGVALDILAAASSGEGGVSVVANVPNQGAIAGMADDDVVEVACRADADGLHPLPVGNVPEAEMVLIKAVKLYERLTVEALRQRSTPLAIEALMAHPLVGSYAVSRSLVQAYLDTHRSYLGAWARA